MSSHAPTAPLETIQTIDPVEQPVSAPPSEPSGPDESTRDRIARRAYELYQRRGRAPGFDADDWYAAERELLADAQPEPEAGSRETRIA